MSQQDAVEQWINELAQYDDGKMTEKQFKIIEAAVEVFAEKGYAGSSTSEIAQRAGVAEGTIFRHYKTKKDLLISIVSPMMNKLIAPFVINNFKEVLVTDYPTFEDFLHAVMVNRLAFFRKHRKIIRIMLQEIPFHPNLQAEFKQQVGVQVFQRLSTIVDHFKSKGELIEKPTHELIRYAGSVMIGLLVTHFLLIPDQPWDEEQEIRDMISLIMNGMSAK